ncbi:dynein regulatory complex protein 8-like [Chrysoperla carnea]|uniref:dynein regulatory complex protein 8-like n=1 Tax=Chrysoperla carnea TaxID=189513 RepID=UPI001D06BF60|nr:dynein regulatory complex protein 8-like [Chrysoperla carnea]
MEEAQPAEQEETQEQQEIITTENLPTELVEIPVEINSDLDKKIVEAFLVFDHADNKTVEVREIGTVLRSLGYCPTEDEIQEVINATVSHDITGSIHLGKFLPYISPLLSARKFQPEGADRLLEAFRLLDKENNGLINKDYLGKLMMEAGDPFSKEELDEMMMIACDPHTNAIPYELYINQLLVE